MLFIYFFTMKQHSLIMVVVILISDFLLPVCVSLTQLLVHNLLNLQRGRKSAGKVGRRFVETFVQKYKKLTKS